MDVYAIDNYPRNKLALTKYNLNTNAVAGYVYIETAYTLTLNVLRL